ncbi:polysaccharide biosynthesis/export family protein [bacterium]|nr:polysaccharide biosynthesis/export family protein [bacterium]
MMKKIIPVLFLALFVSCTIKVGDGSDKNAVSAMPNDESVEEHGSDPLSFIGAGDKINIQVFNEKELSGVYQVSPEGYIMFPFIGKLKVNGMDNFSVSVKIAEKLKDGYLKDPNVTVSVEEFVSKRIFVLGQVKKADSFPIRRRMSVIEAISLAGGFTNLADLSNVVVTRKVGGREKRFVVDIKSIVNGAKENFYLEAGDIVFVGEKFF